MSRKLIKFWKKKEDQIKKFIEQDRGPRGGKAKKKAKKKGAVKKEKCKPLRRKIWKRKCVTSDCILGGKRFSCYDDDYVTEHSGEFKNVIQPQEMDNDAETDEEQL